VKIKNSAATVYAVSLARHLQFKPRPHWRLAENGGYSRQCGRGFTLQNYRL